MQRIKTRFFVMPHILTQFCPADEREKVSLLCVLAITAKTFKMLYFLIGAVMKLSRTLFFYAVILTLFAGGVILILLAGKNLESVRQADSLISAPLAPSLPHPSSAKGPSHQTLNAALGNPLSLFLIQAILIITCARTFGLLFKKLGQPSVMGEITAGLFLGPSLFGGIFPDYLPLFFPEYSLVYLKNLSQVGILVFMFLTGMEIDKGHLKKNAPSALVISHAGILFPFFLGACLSFFIYKNYAPAGVAFAPFCLFMGIAMSITAFPVLAKILEEKKLLGTPVGTTALSCAAADDVTAWTLLAGIVAVAESGSPLIFIRTGLLSAAFVLLMFKVIKPWFRQGLLDSFQQGKNILTRVLILIFTSALATELIGIHALFGAFLAGTLIPGEPRLREYLREKLGFLSHLLLPLFFALSGLKTQIGLVSGTASWTLCLIIIIIAIAGKFGGTAAAAKFTRMKNEECLAIGALMNTRGLMELIVLNIGLELGVISPVIFAMMVMMALITTLMAGPILTPLINRLKSAAQTPLT